MQQCFVCKKHFDDTTSDRVYIKRFKGSYIYVHLECFKNVAGKEWFDALGVLIRWG